MKLLLILAKAKRSKMLMETWSLGMGTFKSIYLPYMTKVYLLKKHTLKKAYLATNILIEIK